jgi:hypothetical protein
MRRSVVLVFVGLALGVAGLVPAAASAAEFEQCPHVDKDAGCQFLIAVTSNGVTVTEDTSEGPYDGEDDTLVGVQNSSSTAVSSIPLSSVNNIFGLDGDGLCDPPEAPRAPGCVILAENGSHEKPTVKTPGTECEINALVTENTTEEPCGVEVPGEPAGLTSFGESGAFAVGFAANGDAVSGYEGPGVWFSSINSGGTGGVVNFSPALAPGAHAYFALEERLTGTSITIGNPTTVSTTLSGGGQTGASISVVQGTAVTDTASLSGAGASVASGSVAYTVYSNSTCTSVAVQAGSGSVSGASAAASSAISVLAPGKYYWGASYSGDINNQAASSTCGSEVLTVLAPTATATVQSAGGVSGTTLTVPQGTSVTDQAHITGALATTATGTVTYVLYKDSKCTVSAATGSVVSVVAGATGPSAAVKPAVGKYYWKATYSGDAANASSTSACGSEVLLVAAKDNNIGLPSSKLCLSRRKFIVHPRAPKGVKLVSVEVQINGKFVKKGKLTKHATTISLVGLPKGTFKVALITTSSTGKLYEDVRTFHTCVPKKHKKH